MKSPKLLYPSFLCLLMAGCDMIDYHPYDVHISGETDVNAHNIAQIEQNCQNKTTIRFVTMGDSQRWYDETDDFVSHLNKRDDIDFVIHGGDVSDFGVTNEFLWQRDIMNKLKIPYVVLLGNHDCLGTGEETYRVIFGDPNFSFIAGRVKFVCLNTNAIEFDYSRPIPDFEFLAAQISDREEEFDKPLCPCIYARSATSSTIMWHTYSSVTSRNFPDCSSVHPHTNTIASRKTSLKMG